MNRNWVYSLFALWIVCSFACTQPKPVANVEVQKENFVFSIKGTDTLSLDKYELPSISPALKKPVMIFAFGGGFKGGDKADKGYIPYFEFLEYVRVACEVLACKIFQFSVCQSEQIA